MIEDNKNIDSEDIKVPQKPTGVIESIAMELTSAKLKQAIIFSEIIGKPKSKTRRKKSMNGR